MSHLWISIAQISVIRPVLLPLVLASLLMRVRVSQTLRMRLSQGKGGVSRFKPPPQPSPRCRPRGRAMAAVGAHALTKKASRWAA